MNRGFINLLALLVLGVLTVVASGVYAKHQADQAKLGGVILTQLTDTIGTFRTNVNTSLTNLTSDIASVTSTIATYGTIVTVNSPVPVANGGTGTTTVPTNGQFFGVSGTTPTWKTFVGSGITITQSPTSTIFTTPGFDSSVSITFTGADIFASSTTFTATSTFSSSTIFNGQVAHNASTTFSANTTTTFAGSVVGLGGRIIAKSNTSIDTTNTATPQTLASFAVPSSVFGTNGGVEIWIPLYDVSIPATNQNIKFNVKLGGSSIMTSTIEGGAGFGANNHGQLHITVFANNSTNAQFGFIYSSVGSFTQQNMVQMENASSGTSAVSTTSTQVLTVTEMNSTVSSNHYVKSTGFVATSLSAN